MVFNLFSDCFFSNSFMVAFLGWDYTCVYMYLLPKARCESFEKSIIQCPCPVQVPNPGPSGVKPGNLSCHESNTLAHSATEAPSGCQNSGDDSQIDQHLLLTCPATEDLRVQYPMTQSRHPNRDFTNIGSFLKNRDGSRNFGKGGGAQPGILERGVRLPMWAPKVQCLESVSI